MPSPQNVHILIPASFECVTLRGKRNFADVVKLRMLRCRDYPGYPGGLRVLIGGRERQKVRVTGALEAATLLALTKEEGATSQGV